MDDLGLGIMVTMKDAFSTNAQHIEHGMTSLDATVAKSSAAITKNMQLVEQGATIMGAGIALAAAPIGLLASTIETGQAVSGLRSMMVQNTDAIVDAAREFSNEWAGNTTDNILQGCYEIKGALANLSDEAVGEFAKAVALTATATKGSFAEMTEAFTTGYGTFKRLAPTMDDMAWAQMYSGALAQVVSSYRATGQSMADAIRNVGPQASSLGISLQEQLAMLGQLQTTMPGSEAGTIFKAFTQNVVKAGGELNLAFVDAQGHLKPLVEIAEMVRQKFPDISNGLAQVQLQKAFGSDEAMKGMISLVQGLDEYRAGVVSVAGAMATGTTVTEQMARAMTGDLGSNLQLIKQEVINLTQVLGTTLVPMAINILHGVQPVILTIQRWAEAHPLLTRVILSTSLALGGLLTVVGSVMAGVGVFGLMLPGIRAGLATLTPIVARLGVTLSTAAPWLLAIGAASTVLYFVWKSNFGGMRDVLSQWWQNVGDVFTGMQQLMSSYRNGVGTMDADISARLDNAGLSGFVTRMFQLYGRVRSFLDGISAGFTGTFGEIATAIGPATRELSSSFSNLLASIGRLFGLVGVNGKPFGSSMEDWGTLGKRIGAGLGWFTEQVLPKILWGITQVINGVQFVVDIWLNVKREWQKDTLGIQEIVSFFGVQLQGTFANIGGFFQGLIDGIAPIFDDLSKILGPVFAELSAAVNALFTAFGSNGTQNMEKAADIAGVLSKVFQGLGFVIGHVLRFAIDVLAAGIWLVTKAITIQIGVITWVRNTWTVLVDTVKEVWKDMHDTIAEKLGNIMKVLDPLGIYAKGFDFGRSMVNGIVQAVRSGSGLFMEALRALLGPVGYLLPHGVSAGHNPTASVARTPVQAQAFGFSPTPALSGAPGAVSGMSPGPSSKGPATVPIRPILPAMPRGLSGGVAMADSTELSATMKEILAELRNPKTERADVVLQLDGREIGRASERYAAGQRTRNFEPR